MNTAQQGAAANPYPLHGQGCSDARPAADCYAKLVTAFRVAELDVRLPDTALQLPFPTGVRLRRVDRAIKERA